MTDSERDTLLREGIAAAKAGERARARELLQQVVEADEENLQAWLWLSGVVTTLEDREVCLENVLTLDPDNAQARSELDRVRAQLAATPEIEPESPLPHPAAEDVRQQERLISVDFADGQFDDPLLCVYCGRLTSEADRRCPHCGRRLYSSFYKRERPAWLWVGWTVGVAEAFFTLGMIIVLLVIVSSAMNAARLAARPIDLVQLLGVYFDAPGTLPAAAQTTMLSVLPRTVLFVRLGYVALMIVTLIGLPSRRRVFHLLYIGSLAVGGVVVYLSANINRELVAPGAAQTPLQGIVQVVIFEMLGVYVTASSALALLFLLLKAVLAFAMEDDFARVTERLWCQIDQTVRESSAAFVRAKTYARRGLWTLAAMYLRKAISLRPATFDYYPALAEAYARLGHYGAGLALLDQAERLQPGAASVANLRQAISSLQAQSAGGA